MTTRMIDADGTTQTRKTLDDMDANSGVKSAATLRVVLATDQPALTNKLLVTPDAVSVPNLPTTVDVNSGVKSASTLRVVLATDQPALTNKLLVTPDAVSVPNLPTTVDTNSGVKSASTLRVVLATDQPALTNKLLVTPDAVSLPNLPTTVDVNSGVKSNSTLRVVLATDQPALTNKFLVTADPLAAGSAIIGKVGIDQTTPGTTNAVTPIGSFVTCSTDITRPADTNAYAVGDAWSDSTSAPTAGGFTLTGAGRISGGSGIITDCIVTSSNPAATALQGEVWIFETSVTNINDNAAFAISDSEVKTLVAKIPFTLVADTNNSAAHAQNLAIGYTAVGTANLRYLVKVKNVYTPASAEVLTVRIKALQIT